MRLYHLRARYLDPDTGRFTQRDPLGPWGDPLALGNPTTYAANNPWTYTDPLGLCAGKDTPPSEGERYLPSMSLAEDKASPFWEGVKGFFSFGGDDAWLAVEGASIFPVFGIPADLALTSRDLYRGDYGMAAISASGMVLGPFAAGLRRVDTVAGVVAPAKRASGQTVFGHYPGYAQLADNNGFRRFDIPERAWNRMTDAERWAANQRFLDRTIRRGDNIVLATPVNEVRPGSYFQRELDYLLDAGYTLSADGTRLLRPGGP